MKAKLLTLLLLTGGSMFAGPRFFFGLGFGGPRPGYYAPPPPPVYAYAPPPVAYAPPPSYYSGPPRIWVDGYQDWAGPRAYWHPGYYANPPFRGARWYAPRSDGGRYYHGYWGRPRY